MMALDPIYQTIYSELAQRSLDAAFVSDFPVDGRFVLVTSKDRRYWYFDRAEGEDRKQRRSYVGPADDAEIDARVKAFKDLKADHRARRKLVATLVREAYLPRPERWAGEIIAALASSGFFRLRGVLVGTVAFRAYSALLGTRLAATAMQTSDTDLAQFHSISAAVGDAMPPMLGILKTVDETFREIPHQIDGRRTTAYASRAGYRVEFLTPSVGSTEHDRNPAPMPALGGASAQPLRFLDFLIHRPVRAVLLHGAGIPVLVPAPERYAVHKLIVATRRELDADGTAKSRKDRLQAAILLQAMLDLRLGDDLAEAFIEAWQRGRSWREAITRSLQTYDSRLQTRLSRELTTSLGNLGEDPARYALIGQKGPADE